MADSLIDTLNELVTSRIASGRWEVVGVAGDRALETLESYLKREFDIDDITKARIAVMIETRKSD